MIPIPSCATCKHFDEEGTDALPLSHPAICTAFPEGIPGSISEGVHQHLTPFEGDHGLQYEALEGIPEELRAKPVQAPPEG